MLRVWGQNLELEILELLELREIGEPQAMVSLYWLEGLGFKV